MSTINSLQCLLYKDLLKFFMTVTQGIPCPLCWALEAESNPKPVCLGKRKWSSPLTIGQAETFKQLSSPCGRGIKTPEMPAYP